MGTSRAEGGGRPGALRSLDVERVPDPARTWRVVVNWSAGRRDYVYAVERDEMLDAYGSIASATALPVSGDLENGYGTSPTAVAETIAGAIARGMVGGSVEDRTSEVEPKLLDPELAEERIRAAREAANASGVRFTLTARAESYFAGDVDDPFVDAVARAERYLAAGADCIFVPGPATPAEIERLVGAVDGPISVGIGSGGQALTVDMLAGLGVRRISTGGLLPRALARFLADAGREILGAGSFGWSAHAMSESEIHTLLTTRPLSPPPDL